MNKTFEIYRSYKIRVCDTLVSIAEENNLDAEELKNYHNKRVDFSKQIYRELPHSLKEIVLPPEGFGIKDGKEVWQDEKKAEPEILRAPFYGKLHKAICSNTVTYGVMKVIRSDGKDNTIKYKLRVHFCPEKESSTSGYLTIDLASEIFINDQTPDLLADEMAVACMQTIYPMVLKIDETGSLADVYNHKEMLENWTNKKTALSEYYLGEVVRDYFEQFEETLISKNALLASLKSDWFLNAYLNNIYTVYPDDSASFVAFPFLPHTPHVKYEVNKQAHKFLKTGRIKIDLQGTCSETENLPGFMRSATNVENEQLKVESDYKAVYYLKAKTNAIEFASITCNWKLAQPKLAFICIYELQNEPVLQKKDQPITADEKRNSAVDSGKKKSLWKSLFT